MLLLLALVQLQRLSLLYEGQKNIDSQLLASLFLLIFDFFVSSELKSRFKAAIYNFFECPTVLNDRALFGNK